MRVETLVWEVPSKELHGMADIAVPPNSYLDRQARRKSLVYVILAVTAEFLCGLLVGLAISSPYRIYSLLALPVVGLLAWATWKWMDRVEKDRDNFVRGMDGETRVAIALSMLPEAFRVFHNLDEDFGNIDHLVVGPTGMFAIETKNWKGIVSSDGKGELLANGRPASKPNVRRFTARIMGLKEKVQALTRLDPFICGLMVFPIARVEVRNGQTGTVDCLSLEHLCDHIQTKSKGRALSNDEVAQIAKAVEKVQEMREEHK